MVGSFVLDIYSDKYADGKKRNPETEMCMSTVPGFLSAAQQFTSGNYGI